MNQLHPEKMADILVDMVERKSIRGLARTMRGNSGDRRKRVSINTVLKLLEDAGNAAIRFLDKKLKKLPCRVIEADEVYAIVKLKPATLAARGIKTLNLGAVWIWVAIDAESRLIIHWMLGGRTQRDANAFMKGLSGRLAGKVQLTTDSLAAYVDAVEAAFDDIDYATVKKQNQEEERLRLAAELAGIPYRPRFKRKRLGDVPKEPEKPQVRMGNPDLSLATTNHIEAFFGELRKDLSRMTRRGKLLSKTIPNLNRAVGLYVVHHNFVKRHSSLDNQTPAVAAGIEDSVWTWDDFIVFVEEFRAARRAARKEYKRQGVAQPEEAEVAKPPAAATHEAEALFCVFQDRKQDTSRLHLLSCRHLRLDPERAGKLGNGVKHRCATLEQATALAESLTPGRVETCKVCLGRYNSKDYLPPR